METTAASNCMFCGNKELCFGYFGSTAANIFVPSNMFTIHGFRIRAYVCLKCGHVGMVMSQEKLEKLRERFDERFTKADSLK